jgi:hypothetical protein
MLPNDIILLIAKFAGPDLDSLIYPRMHCRGNGQCSRECCCYGCYKIRRFWDIPNRRDPDEWFCSSECEERLVRELDFGYWKDEVDENTLCSVRCLFGEIPY